MNDQMWGLGGVLAGIVFTGACTWWNERSKHRREMSAAKTKENRQRCEALLSSVDEELVSLDDYQDQHGVFPVDHGHEPSVSTARKMLTQLDIHCPPKLYASAVALVEATEAWGWQGGTKSALDASRLKFIEQIKKRL